MISNRNIDEGKGFDFGRTSENYAKFTDIYPREFYEKIVEKGLCVSGQNVLDIGTGTGVLPRNMYQYGATWTGIDILDDGKFVILYMAWLPSEDEIAGASENLVLTYNPTWTGAGEMRKPIYTPDRVRDDFTVITQEVYDIEVPFTRESWHGRMKTCRGVGASLSEKIAKWEIEHQNLLNKIAPESFNVLHYVAMTVLKVK